MARVIFNQLQLIWPLSVVALFFLAALVWAYFRAPTSGGTRLLCLVIKLFAFLLLAFCLIEPMIQEIKPREGANLMLLVSDNSQSMNIADAGQKESRGELLKTSLSNESRWQTRLEQDFDVRRFTFETRVKRVKGFESLDFDGRGSAITSTLATLKARFQNRPVAGILLFTDGNTTDTASDGQNLGGLDLSDFPPIYPVMLGSDKVDNDISVSNITVAESNFEAAPVTIRAEIQSSVEEIDNAVAELLDSTGQSIEQQTIKLTNDGKPTFVRFQFQPTNPGIDFYRLIVARKKELDAAKQNGKCSEPTMANNDRQILVNRQQGPFRVLYVSGRPNWEFKYLRRAVEEDEEVRLVGLVRIARKEPKFDFRSRTGESTNPLFRGFGEDGETAEQYDEPVMIRLGTEEDDELRGGFPKTAEELFKYQAIILDDVEAGFFKQDQMELIKLFVSRRGGGLMMLGGADSFYEGGYRRTPIADVLPVYVSASGGQTSNREEIDFDLSRQGFSPDALELQGKLRFDLARDGWLSSWMRLRKTEDEEKERLAKMSLFASANKLDRIKPGAEILATLTDENDEQIPALAVQTFGRGRCAAISVGDFWRWALRRQEGDEQDLEPTWRQTVRWLVADVPKRVTCQVEEKNDGAEGLVSLRVTIYQPEFLPLDNADVQIEVTRPDGSRVNLTAQASAQESGVYETEFASRETGGYRVNVSARGADGSEIGSYQAGWVFEPSRKEFAELAANSNLLSQLAAKTGGEVLKLEELNEFVSGLSKRDIPITETKTSPLWHKWYFFLLAIGLLMTEWGIRRVKGLP